MAEFPRRNQPPSQFGYSTPVVGIYIFSRRQAKYNKVLSKIKNIKNNANKILILYVNLTQ